MIKGQEYVKILVNSAITLEFLQQTAWVFFPPSQLPSNFSYVGGCQDFMAIWLSYPSRWLALFYAKMSLQSLICLIALEVLCVRLLKNLNISPPKRPKVGCDCMLFIQFGLKICFLTP